MPAPLALFLLLSVPLGARALLPGLPPLPGLPSLGDLLGGGRRAGGRYARPTRNPWQEQQQPLGGLLIGGGQLRYAPPTQPSWEQWQPQQTPPQWLRPSIPDASARYNRGDWSQPWVRPDPFPDPFAPPPSMTWPRAPEFGNPSASAPSLPTMPSSPSPSVPWYGAGDAVSPPTSAWLPTPPPAVPPSRGSPRRQSPAPAPGAPVTFSVWRDNDALAFLPPDVRNDARSPVLAYIHPVYRLPLEDLVLVHNRAWLESFAQQGNVVLCSLRLEASGLRALPERGYSKETFREPGNHALAYLRMLCSPEGPTDAAAADIASRIDCSRIAVMGYSVGGTEAVRVSDELEAGYGAWLARSQAERDGAPPPRVRAAVSLAPTIGLREPFGTGAREELLDAGRMARTPLLLLTGTADRRGGLEGAQAVYKSRRRAPRVLQEIDGVGHCWLSLHGAECGGGACGDCAASRFTTCARACAPDIKAQQAVGHALSQAFLKLLLHRDVAAADAVWTHDGALAVAQRAAGSANAVTPKLVSETDPAFAIALVRVEAEGVAEVFSDGSGNVDVALGGSNSSDGKLRLVWLLRRGMDAADGNEDNAHVLLVRATTAATTADARLTLIADRRRFRVRAEVPDLEVLSIDDLVKNEEAGTIVMEIDAPTLGALTRRDLLVKITAMDAGTAVVRTEEVKLRLSA